jgi:chromosome segregation ATPase
MSEDFQSSGAMRLVAHRLGEVETTMKSLAHSVERLVVIEERLAQTAANQERAFRAIESLDSRLKSVETKMPEATRTSQWLDRGLWATAAAAVVYVAKKTGLM